MQPVESNCDRKRNARRKLKRSATGPFPDIRTDTRLLFQDPYTSTSLENSIRHQVMLLFIGLKTKFEVQQLGQRGREGEDSRNSRSQNPELPSSLNL